MTLRTMTAAAIAAASSPTGSFGHLLKIRFGGGDVRLTTFGHDITYAGESYSAVGGNFSLGVIEENGAIVNPPKLDLTLDGVDRSVISLVAGDYYVGRTLTVWRAYLSNTNTLIADPIQLGTFYMNGSWTYTEQHNELGPVTAFIRTTVSSRLIVGSFHRGIITNLKSHQRFFSGDTFYKYIEKMSANEPITWAGTRVLYGRRTG